MPRPASSTAAGLHAPVNAASADGSPKMPAPITELMTAAVRSRRPMTRSSAGERTEMLIDQLDSRREHTTRLPLHRRQDVLHEQSQLVPVTLDAAACSGTSERAGAGYNKDRTTYRMQTHGVSVS
jgi:hypothetical protein